MDQLHSTPALARHVSKAWPEADDLLRAGEAVQQLAESFGWTLVVDIINREIAMIDRELDEPSEPLSQAEYALKHGRRGGLMAARSVVETILVKYAQELAEQRAKHEGSGESLPERVGV